MHAEDRPTVSPALPSRKVERLHDDGQMAARADRMPLLNGRGVILSFLAAILLCWPMLLVTAPLGFFDTIEYLDAGEAVFERLAGGAEGEAPRSLRSVPYAVFVHLTAGLPGGLVLLTLIQTTAVLVLFLPFIEPVAPGRLWAVGPILLALGGLTTLPWIASSAMPDLLAAAVLLYFMLLAGRMDHLPVGWQAAFLAIATFAAASHTGYLPLAAGLFLAVLAVRFLVGRSVAWMATLAAALLALGAVFTLVASAAATGEASLAPKRLPLLLARSIEDGPGRRFLEQSCPEADYAFCDAFDEVPAGHRDFLWEEHGVFSIPEAQLDAIRAEEFRLLWDIFRAYPAEQAWAFLGNAATQLVRVGTGQIQPLVPTAGPGGPTLVTSGELYQDSRALVAFDDVTKVGTALGLLLLAWVLLRESPRRSDLEVVAVCILGLLGNALIFGGLSAPADRYQSRLIWILPALAAILWLRGPPAEGQPSRRTTMKSRKDTAR